MMTVGATFEVHLLLEGVVDPVKEISRLERKIKTLRGQIDKLQKVMDAEGYEKKVKSNIGKFT